MTLGRPLRRLGLLLVAALAALALLGPDRAHAQSGVVEALTACVDRFLAERGRPALLELPELAPNADRLGARTFVLLLDETGAIGAAELPCREAGVDLRIVDLAAIRKEEEAHDVTAWFWSIVGDRSPDAPAWNTVTVTRPGSRYRVLASRPTFLLLTRP